MQPVSAQQMTNHGGNYPRSRSGAAARSGGLQRDREDDMVELYHSVNSVCAQKVRIALAEKIRAGSLKRSLVGHWCFGQFTTPWREDNICRRTRYQNVHAAPSGE